MYVYVCVCVCKIHEQGFRLSNDRTVKLTSRMTGIINDLIMQQSFRMNVGAFLHRNW